MNEKNNQKTPVIRIARRLLLTLVFGALALGFFIGSGITGIRSLIDPDRGEAASGEESFKFIRALPETGPGSGHVPAGELKPFRYKIKGLIDQEREQGNAAAVSIYFRDLNNGNWIGIDEREALSPMKSLKLPLMIAYFKWAESNPLVLRRSLTYAAANRKEGASDTITGLESGKSYSVNDLIFRMVVHTDEAAFTLLRVNIPASRLERVFKDLNSEYDPRSATDSLSLRAYASFYRVLFNASYLSEEMSEKALRYLSKSPFRDRVDLPVNIDIAGTFAERILDGSKDNSDKQLHQLHEFGIIYHPRRPFLLGIMARGEDRSALVKTIREITSMIYDEVDQQS